MLIRVVRSTVAAPAGGNPRICDPGDVLDAEAMVAAQLIRLGRAVAVDCSTETQSTEDALPDLEIRPERPRRKRQ